MDILDGNFFSGGQHDAQSRGSVRKHTNCYFLLSNRSIEGFLFYSLIVRFPAGSKIYIFGRLLKSAKLLIIPLIQRYMTTAVYLITVLGLYSTRDNGAPAHRRSPGRRFKVPDVDGYCQCYRYRRRRRQEDKRRSRYCLRSRIRILRILVYPRTTLLLLLQLRRIRRFMLSLSNISLLQRRVYGSRGIPIRTGSTRRPEPREQGKERMDEGKDRWVQRRPYLCQKSSFVDNYYY